MVTIILINTFYLNVFSQNIGLKIVNSQYLDGTSFQATSTTFGVAGVTHAPSTPYETYLGKGTFKFFTFDQNLDNKKIVSSDTSGTPMGFIQVSGGYLLMSFYSISVDTFVDGVSQKYYYLIPQLILLSDKGKIIWKQEFGEFFKDAVPNFRFLAKAVETNASYDVCFTGFLFSVDKKTGELIRSIELPGKLAPFLLENYDNSVIFCTRNDISLNEGREVISTQYDFYCIDEVSSQNHEIGVVTISDIEKWHHILPIEVTKINTSYSEKVSMAYLGKDSFEFVIYGDGYSNYLDRETIRKVNITNSSITHVSLSLPFIRYSDPVFGLNIGYSKTNKYWYVASSDKDYRFANMLVTSNFQDTVFLLQEETDAERVDDTRISEMADGSFLFYGRGYTGSVFISLNKVARVPFKVPALYVNWDGSMDFAPPLNGGSELDAYEIWYKTNNDWKWEIAYLGNINTYKLKNLKSFSTYSIKVRAHNMAGWGEFSDIATLQTKNLSIHKDIKNTLNVYPNPICPNGVLTISDIKANKACIFSLNGELVFESTMLSNQLNLPNLSNGVYIISVYVDDKIYHSKLLIQ